MKVSIFSNPAHQVAVVARLSLVTTVTSENLTRISQCAWAEEIVKKGWPKHTWKSHRLKITALRIKIRFQNYAHRVPLAELIILHV